MTYFHCGPFAWCNTYIDSGNGTEIDRIIVGRPVSTHLILVSFLIRRCKGQETECYSQTVLKLPIH